MMGYFFIINTVSAVITVCDKIYAKKKSRRIKEKTLMLFGILGGSLAMYFTMLIISHKTKHRKFMITLPILMVFQLGILVKIFSAIYN